jgi:molecular chaperone DnaK
MVTRQPFHPQTGNGNPILGIDFGTSKSIVAIIQGENPVIIPDPQGRKSIPSLVMIGQDERFSIGWEALNHPDRYHSKQFTINSVKRQVGKAGETSWGGYKTYPQEIAALILGQLKFQAEAYLDQEKIDQTVIAIPANFNINQRWAILQAAEIAGFQVLRLLNEATAAVLAARHSLKQDSTVLVFDFGAGTLDVSIIVCGDDVFQVMATAGDDHLGGDDIDQLLYDHLLEQAKLTIGPSLELTPVEQLVLKDAARRAKIELSHALSTQVFIPGFLRTPNQSYDLNGSLTRTAFESLCNPLFKQTESVIKRAIADANLSGMQLVNQVFMIGGSSKIPRIRSLVESITNRKPSTLIDPELGVAQGAAIQAGVLGGTVKDVLLLNVLPSTLSVTTQGGVATPLIERNTTIPTKMAQIFSTTQDNTLEITIQVVQGEKPLASQSSLVGSITLTGIPPAPKGIPQIEVTFDVDANEDLQVSAKDKATGRSVQAVMQSPYRLNLAQLKVLKRKVTKELEDFHQQAAKLYEQQRLELARQETLAFMDHLDQLLQTAEGGLSQKYVSLLVSGKGLLQNYLDWFVTADKLHFLQASIQETCYEAVSASIVAEWVTISQSTEFTQWAYRTTSIWDNPAALDESLQQFGSQFNPSITKTVEVTRLPLFVRDDILLNKMFEQVKDSTSTLLLLAIVLEHFGNRDVSLPIIDTSQPEQQTLHMIFMLDTLRKSSPGAKRKAAKSLFYLTHHTIEPRPQLQLAVLQQLEEFGIQDTIPECIGFLSPKNDPAVTIKLVELLTATHDARVVAPILGLLDQNSRLNRLFLEKLASCREVMTVDLNRFYDLACKVVLDDRSVSLKERIFLTRFSSKHPELAPAIKIISGKKS